ncbi:MAG: MMPL family transporter, partial [Deltaproteobacteria bacterium]|nr:MMPL family transporter [Deltaproteobacteria bacterium]
MSQRIKKAELFFEKLIKSVIRKRYLVLIGVFLCSGFLGYQIKSLQFDTSNEGFLHKDDNILTVYNDFREQFGRDDMLALAIYSEDIFSATFLQKLKALHDELKEVVPYVNDITSLINVRNTLGKGDTLIVDDLLRVFPETREEFERLRNRTLANPLYLNQYISEDGLYTTVLIESDVYSRVSEDDLLSGFAETSPGKGPNAKAPTTYLSDRENDEFVEAVHRVVKKHQGPDFIIFTAGPPVNLHAIKYFLLKDVKQFMLLAILIIGTCLYVMFRRMSGVILPLIVVALSLVSTIGLMSFLEVSFKLPTSILPSFLLTVGVGACVHVLSLTYQSLRNGVSKHQAIVDSFVHSGLAITMTSLTTAAGLASFAMAKVAPIADLGKFSAIGVMISLVYTFTFLPAIISLLPLRQKKNIRVRQETVIDKILESLAEFAIKRHLLVIGFATTIIIIGAIGVSRVLFSHDGLLWLPKDLDIRKATEVIDRELNGSVVLEVILDTGKENGLYNRDVLLKIDSVNEALQEDYQNNDPFIGKTMSVTTVLKEIHQALHENDPAYYKIPENEKLIPQEFLLFENSGSDDLQNVVDSQFRQARITLKVPWRDALIYIPFIKDVKGRFDNAFSRQTLDNGNEMRVTVTGIMSLFGRIIHAAMYSAAQSYGIALVVITLLMIVLLGNLKLGLICMIPNLGPIFTVLGIMGWLSIRLDMFTMLIASIVIGIAVDDTIHFMYNFKRYFNKTADVTEAVRSTFDTAGRAMLTTSVVLAVGFFIFMFASMNNLFYFGLLAGSAVILALAADLLLAPALMT